MSLKHGVYVWLAIGLLAMAPASGVAQERVPHAGSTAVGFDVGAFVPSDDQLDVAPVLGALFEYYLTPRVSMRTGFGFADPSFSGGNSLRQVPLKVDLNYNWEGGRWHPFVGTGVGAYFLQSKNSNGTAFGNQETKFGFNLGGGMEYFVNRRVAVKGEGRYNIIEDAATGVDPSGLGLSVGLKTYF
jgi:opacity protein-like surface antigen